MKLLVTGGAGFIGSYFIKYMLKTYEHIEIVNLDALTYAGNLDTLASIEKDKRYTFIKGNITDVHLVDQLFEKERFDKVVHFAAESHVDRSLTDPGIFVQTNVVGTYVLLEAAKKYDIKQFHHISTDEVYGDLPLDRKDLLFTEDMPLRPSSPYSASKASSDMLVLAYHRTYKLPVTLSRCSNNYGPFHFPEKLIPLTIGRILYDEKIPVYGTGENIRDWLFVEDHCRAIDRILQKGKMGEVYNIGGNNELTNLEVVKILLEVLGKSADLITFVADRKGHDLRYAIDASKMKRELEWQPQYTFKEGIGLTVEWYLNHREWWEPKIIRD